MDTTQMVPGEEVFVDDEIIFVGVQNTERGACVKYTLAGEDDGKRRTIWENLENPANARITMERLLELGTVRKDEAGELETDETGDVRMFDLNTPISIPNQHISIEKVLHNGALITSYSFRLRGHNEEAAKRGLKAAAQFRKSGVVAKAASKSPSRQRQ